MEISFASAINRNIYENCNQKQKDAFLLFFQQKTLKEISEALKIKLPTLKTWSSRYKWQDLRKDIREKGPNDTPVKLNEIVPKKLHESYGVKVPDEKYYTAADLAKYFDVSMGAIRDYVQLGMPRENGKYPKAESALWLAKHFRDQQTQNKDAIERLTLAKAEKTEVERDLLFKKLVPFDDICEEYKKIIATIKAELLGIPGRLAAELADVQNAAEAKNVLSRDIRNSLNTASRAVDELYERNYGYDSERDEGEEKAIRIEEAEKTATKENV